MPEAGQQGYSHVIIAHNLVHMREAHAAAQALGVPLVLQTATGALRFAGAEYLLTTYRKARTMYPGVDSLLILQCDDAAAETIHAMRSGHTHIRTSAPEPTRSKLVNIAGQLGIVVADGEFSALDLVYEYDTRGACMKWLSARAAA